VVLGGTPSQPGWDRYVVYKINAANAIVATYNINHAATAILNCPSVLTSVFQITLDKGERFRFYASSLDDHTGTSLAKLTAAYLGYSAEDDGTSAARITGKSTGWEAGCLVSYTLVS
jgi:hypothetical protein